MRFSKSIFGVILAWIISIHSKTCFIFDKPDFSRAADDGEEHPVEVEVPEVSGNLHPVEKEGDDGDGQVEGDADVVALLDVGHVDAGNDEGATASGPEVGSVEAVRVEVVSDPVASPFFTASRIGHIPIIF